MTIGEDINMASYPNRFFRGWCSNEGNGRSYILHYHIYTVRDIGDHSGGTFCEEINSLEEYFNIDGLSISDNDPYYIVVATFKFNVPRGPLRILETNNLKDAVYIVEHISGNKVIENAI